MKRYRVVEYYTVAKTFEVNADSEQEAVDMVAGGQFPPETVGGQEFCDETVEEIV
jgi:hypothetical protein